MGCLAALDRFNRAHPWSHNDHFARFVLRQARRVRRHGGTTAVDVGCGTGNLIARLSRIFPDVRGIEPDPATAMIAKARFSDSISVRVAQRPFEGDTAQYDLIVFVASLHHMPLTQALRDARQSLRPGGRIVIVGLSHEADPDRPRELISLALNPIIGLLRHPRPAGSAPNHMQAPITEVTDSYTDIQQIAQSELPGIRMRRRLLVTSRGVV